MQTISMFTALRHDRKRRVATRTVTVVVVALALVGMVSVSAVRADNPDPQGVQLKRIVQDYIDSAPKDDPKVKELKNALRANAISEGWANFLCNLEAGTGVGGVIWIARLYLDSCDVPDTSPKRTVFDYCMDYSMKCDHWTWDAGCLKSKNACDIQQHSTVWE